MSYRYIETLPRSTSTTPTTSTTSPAFLFIVSSSYHYYPSEGCGDWVSVHTETEPAREAMLRAAREGRTTCVIRVDLSTLAYEVIDRER